VQNSQWAPSRGFAAQASSCRSIDAPIYPRALAPGIDIPAPLLGRAAFCSSAHGRNLMVRGQHSQAG